MHKNRILKLFLILFWVSYESSSVSSNPLVASSVVKTQQNLRITQSNMFRATTLHAKKINLGLCKRYKNCILCTRNSSQLSFDGGRNLLRDNFYRYNQFSYIPNKLESHVMPDYWPNNPVNAYYRMPWVIVP